MVILIPYSAKFLQVESGTLGLESVIQHKETGIPLTIGIRLSSSTDKKSGIHSVQSRIQDFHESYFTWGELRRSILVDKDEHGKQSEQIVSMQKSGYLVFLMELALFGIRSINPGFRLANIKSKFDLSTTTNRK